MRLSFGLGFLLLLLGLAGVAAPADGSAPAAPTGTDCRLTRHGAGGVAARCLSVEVPEDYADPAGAKLGLKVAVVPAVGGAKAGEPLFVLAGGPGQAATDFYSAVAGAFSYVNRTHDLVLVDQRGTGGSNRLDCHFPDDFDTQSPPPAEIERLSRECLATLPGRAQFYTTSVAVRDLDAVRAKLGYPQLSLYGVSYGTRVAQHYLRRYPDRVRAVILDGVVAPAQVLGPSIAPDAERALHLIFARCAADPACHGAFADPAADLAKVRSTLERAPANLSLADPLTGKMLAVRFGAEQLAAALRLLSYSASTSSLLPLLLNAAARGELAPLASQFVLYSHTLDQQIAYGMHNAVVCSEDVPFFGAVNRAALEHTYLGAGEVDALKALCAGWPQGVRDADFATPLIASVPVLLLSGEADPVTPPEGAARAVQGLDQALSLTLPGQGHGQLGTGCVPELLARFLKAGSIAGLDTSCVGRSVPPPFFIDFAGPAP